MNTSLPNCLKSIIIPEKDKLLNFYNNLKEINNLNMLFIGIRETCKTTIIELIIEDFLKENKRYPENKLIFRLNTFNEINLQNEQNILHSFCQTNINCNKIVYIDKFEFFSDSNQQHMKNYMDRYNTFREKNKVFFIFEGISQEKIRDVIKSRLNIFTLSPLRSNEYRKMFQSLLSSSYITINDDSLSQIVSYSSLTISILKNIIIKSKLLSIEHITHNEHMVLCDFLIFSDAESYFDNILEGKLDNAIEILMEMYKNGTDISDIYFGLYEYIKINEKIHLYPCIKYICEYINEIYNGNYNRIMLVLISHDIYNCVV